MPILPYALGEGVAEVDLRSGKMGRGVSWVRRMVCQVAVDKLGYSGVEVARVLGVTTSAVVGGRNLGVFRVFGNIYKFTRNQRPLFHYGGRFPLDI